MTGDMEDAEAKEIIASAKAQMEAAAQIQVKRAGYIYIPTIGWVERVNDRPQELSPAFIRAIVNDVKARRRRYTFGVKR